MIRRFAVSLALLLIAAAPHRAAEPMLALRNVTVIAAGGAAPLAHHTVLVRGERIAAIGPAADLTIPADAAVVDGTGLYLAPGLIEMHAHTSKSRASSLGLFVANGVTTVRDVGGDLDELLQWRREITAGTRIGPRLVIAGPYLESARNIERMKRDPPEARVEPFDRIRIPIGSPDDARRVVASLAVQELDFLKVRTVENEATYRALVEAAHAHGLKLVGHVTGISPQVVLEAGQDGIEHPFYPSLEQMTQEQRIAIWRRFADRGVAVVPTVVVLFESAFKPVEYLRGLAAEGGPLVDPRCGYVARFTMLDWREQAAEQSEARTAGLRKLWDQTIKRDLLEMHAAGMDVLAGSDVSVLNIFPGFTLHEELGLFVSELGMTPAEALDRATLRSARFLGIADSVGSVARGKIADLVLLDANPLDDIRNTRRVVGVVLRGSYFDRKRLDALLEATATHPDRQKDDWGRTRPK